MIAFLPIARYRVEYQVASGRPFSSFERLLLRAVGDGHGNVESLATMFRLHRRLIIEGLVTLMQAGWVSLESGESSFVVTASGEKACAGESLPPTIAISDRFLTIVVEKVTGQVARNNEVDFHLRNSLRNVWDAGVVLRKGDVSNIIDPALIAQLLPRQSTEWIRWIGPISVVNDNAAFAVIDVDTTSGRISGVPKRWELSLQPDCVAQVLRRERHIAESGVVLTDDEARKLVRSDLHEPRDDGDGEAQLEWPYTQLKTTDVLRSRGDQRNALDMLLDEAASMVALSVPNLSQLDAAELARFISVAVTRGLLVSLMLGKIPAKDDASGASETFAALRKTEYDTRNNGGAGRLAMSGVGTGCLTTIVVADTEGGGCALLGDIFSLPADGNDRRAVRLVDSWAVADLCEVLAGFASADERLRLDAGFVRLKKAAGDLRQIAQPVTGAVAPFSGQLLLERDHLRAIGSIAAHATVHLTVHTENVVDFCERGWLDPLIAAAEGSPARFHVEYSAPAPLESLRLTSIEAALKNGITFGHSPQIVDTVVVADEDAVLFASARPPRASVRQLYSSRIGLLVKGQGAAAFLGAPA